MLSIVVPVYNCKECLTELYNKLAQTLNKITDQFEVVMVDDASSDGSWALIEALAKEHTQIKGVLLSRNFGQHNAISAGLHYISGDYIVIIDCDLQYDPEEIPRLYNKLLEGFDYVTTKRVGRQDKFHRKVGAYLLYKLLDFLDEYEFNYALTNFAIYSRQIIENYKTVKEQYSPLVVTVQWMGFQGAIIEVQHQARHYGNSSYTFRKLLKLATVNFITYSNKPLIFSIQLGGVLAFLAFLYGTFVTLKYFLYGIPVEGWSSLIVSIYFLGGLILTQLGILGLYIARIFDEVKGRPLYLVKKTVGVKMNKTFIANEYENPL